LDKKELAMPRIKQPAAKRYTYTVHIEPAEEGGYVVTVPGLPGCVTQGETYAEAVAMAQEVIEGFVEALLKAGEPVPEDPEPTHPVDALVHRQTIRSI
jgi:predicted RNase H-like HicB family nuclease